MGISSRRGDGAAETRNDAAPTAVVAGLGSDRGRFSEEVESEIAEVRGRMRSFRRVGSVSSGSGDNSTAGDVGNGGNVGGKGVFQSFRESLFASRATPELANPPAPVQKSSVTDSGSGSASGSGSGSGREGRESAVVSSTPDENRRKLRALMERVKLEMRPLQLEEALGGFEEVAGHCRVLCGALVAFEVRRRRELQAKIRGGSEGAEGAEGPAGAVGELIANEELVRALEKSPALMEVREWRQTVTALGDGLSRKMEGAVSEPAAVSQGGNVPVSTEGDNVGVYPGLPVMSGPELKGLQGIYRQRQSRVLEELGYLTQLLEFPAADLPPATQDPDVSRRNDSGTQEPGISSRSDPTTQDFDISKRGNAILEFPIVFDESNEACDSTTPAPRKVTFRVSSHILSEASPTFADLFSKHDPESPRRGMAPPGRARATTHRMPHLHPHEIRPLEILLHAAHTHTDRIPRSIPFAELVAIAGLCLRFSCTAPLELFVEMCWLPEWVHMGIEAVPGGLLLVSYAFGMRGLFTRMTKSVVLNVVGEEELGAGWPVELRERIWAVRQAKVEQIYACCVAAVQEYLRGPRESAGDAGGRPRSIWEEEDEEPAPSPHGQTGSQSLFPYLSASPPAPARDRPFLTSTPRCPKGNHECDAANLGYFMLVLSELQLLPVVMNPGALAQGVGAVLPQCSLAQLVRALQRVPGPANAVHRGGVCDPVPAFRGAVMDIFNSLEGLTLFEVTGRHGYGLSRRYEGTPQRVLGQSAAGSGRDVREGVEGVEVPGEVALGILRGLGTVGDLRAVALVSREFYEVYKRHESTLVEGLDGARDGDDGPHPSPELEVLTEEEARRIIWPDSPIQETPPAYEETGREVGSADPLELGAATSEGSREKFRVEDALFGEGKVLSVVETKQLTAEHDVYVGMHRDKVEVGG